MFVLKISDICTKFLNYELVKSKVFRKEIKIFKLTSRLFQICFVLEWNADSWLFFFSFNHFYWKTEKKESNKM